MSPFESFYIILTFGDIVYNKDKYNLIFLVHYYAKYIVIWQEGYPIASLLSVENEKKLLTKFHCCKFSPPK